MPLWTLDLSFPASPRAAEHLATPTQLPEEIQEHKDGRQDVATVPGGVDVVPLLAPLKPHADAVFEEGADEAEAGHVRKVLFGHSQELPGENTTTEGP